MRSFPSCPRTSTIGIKERFAVPFSDRREVREFSFGLSLSLYGSEEKFAVPFSDRREVRKFGFGLSLSL
jgi:hypothetical protein